MVVSISSVTSKIYLDIDYDLKKQQIKNKIGSRG